MDDIVLTPEPEQKSYWRLILAIIFVILVIPGVIILAFSIIGGVIYIVSVLAPLLFTLYWIPLYYSAMKFSITGEHVVVEKGVWWKKESTIPFEMITNVDKTQDPFERYYKIGKIHVQTAGAGGAQGATAEAVIQGIKNRDEVREEIKSRVRVKKGKPMPKVDEKELLSKILDEIKGLRKDLKG
ncbi:MAG: PH domain-containing protein [Methanosarcinales archaeon]